jgi:hypothetical protein
VNDAGGEADAGAMANNGPDSNIVFAPSSRDGWGGSLSGAAIVTG